MKNLILTLSILVLAAACSRPSTTSQPETIDPLLAPYLTQFKIEASSRGVAVDESALIMRFSDAMPTSSIPETNMVGYCSPNPSNPTIVVSRTYFTAHSVFMREQLLFHELGHCLLALHHTTGTEESFDSTGANAPPYRVPSSIMTPILFPDWLYTNNRTVYLDRLFASKVIDSRDILYWNGASEFNISLYQGL